MQTNSNSELSNAGPGEADFDIAAGTALATIHKAPMQPPETHDDSMQYEEGSKKSIAHLDIVRVVERLHRRSLDLMRTDLIKAGITDLSPSQVMMLFTIGPADLSVRELIERGYYLGSNASYILKRLVEGEYIVRTTSERDRRSARVRLSEKGVALCQTIRRIDRTYHRLVTRSEEEVRDLEVTFQTLMRLEKTWSNALRYGGVAAEE